MTHVRIAPENWLPATFATSLYLCDVLRHPEPDYCNMSADEQNRLRQSQIDIHETVRVLGLHQQHILIMKWDQVLGWVPQTALHMGANPQEFSPPVSTRTDARQFFQQWQNTPYVWGGISRAGIDCSGLTQRYYLDVLGQSIPKNTYNQRHAGRSKRLEDVSNHDLVFCTRIGGAGIHHVAIYLDGMIWHAHGERGVICQSLEEFVGQYQVLEVVDLRGIAFSIEPAVDTGRSTANV